MTIYFFFFLHQWIPKLNVILSLTITSKHFHCSPADGSYSVWSGWIEMQSRQKGRVQSQSAGRCASLVERWSSGGDTLLYRNCITQMHEQIKSVWSKDFFPNVSTFSYLTQETERTSKDTSWILCIMWLKTLTFLNRDFEHWVKWKGAKTSKKEPPRKSVLQGQIYRIFQLSAHNARVLWERLFLSHFLQQ